MSYYLGPKVIYRFTGISRIGMNSQKWEILACEYINDRLGNIVGC